jgi:uncharacterized protein (DUF433 family)
MRKWFWAWYFGIFLALIACCADAIGGCPAYEVFFKMMDRAQIVHSDPEILGGEPVFVGTRVPVKTLLVYLEGGETLDEFLDNFPTVTREQAVAFLEESATTLLAGIA